MYWNLGFFHRRHNNLINPFKLVNSCMRTDNNQYRRKGREKGAVVKGTVILGDLRFYKINFY